MREVEVEKSQLLPGGLSLNQLGVRYSKKFNVLMVYTSYIKTVFEKEERKVIYLPFYINKLPLWQHKREGEYIEIYDLW